MTLTATLRVQLLEESTSSLKKHVRTFIKSQLELVEESLRCKRFTLKGKILGVVVHKQSNKTYKILRTLFCLPTPKTLSKFLERMGIKAGINKSIFKNYEKVWVTI